MKYLDEFRNPQLIAKAVDEICRLADPQRQYRLMEVCGGHTHAIYRFGLKDLLPANIELIHGPGCPVCVLPMGRIDDGLAIAAQPDVIFAAFGDMMRVPGTHGSPLEHKARGMNVRVIYSPSDAIKLAQSKGRLYGRRSSRPPGWALGRDASAAPRNSVGDSPVDKRIA